jgi:hypothetical protein
MPVARRLAVPLAALLIVLVTAPGLQAQIEGESWTSPTYGFTLSWAGTAWQPQPDGTLVAVGAERLDRLHLVNGTSSLYIEGATRYGGNLASCVAQEANLLGQETGVAEIRPYRDDDGMQLTAAGPDAQAAAFTLTLSVGEQEVQLIDYVECRTLIPGEAVLIITLVTEPPNFRGEFAAAQPVIDSITLGSDLPADPLAAYGGWLAAAQQRPSIAGPLSGELAFGPDELAVERASVDAPDAYVRAVFTNPEPPREAWDFGLGFRDSGDDEQFRLVVDAAGNWFFKEALGPVIAGGTLVDVDTSPGGENTIELVAVGDTGYFAFNERLVDTLDLSARTEGGDHFVGAGFFTEDAAEAGATVYSEFEIWSLEGIDAAAILAPVVEMDRATFDDLAAAAIATNPLAGPADGDLVETLGSATVAPAGVEVENFVARVDFVNPSDAAERPWDFGIAFREQENGDHYRLTVSSDGSWEYQIGLQAPLAEGRVPSLSFEEGARNTLEVVVNGDAAAFSVNDAFVSDLDVSDLAGAADVWVGAGFHRGNTEDGRVTRFLEFTVWEAPSLATTTTQPAAMATPVASGAAPGEPVALRLEARADAETDAFAVLTPLDGETTVTVTARETTGQEVVVIQEGGCAEAATLPAFLLADFDAGGRSETTIAAPLADLTARGHAIAIHRSADAYGEVVACGDIPGAE